MSRSGYSDEIDDPLVLGRWRGRVASALRGKRGQAFLRETLAALDAMPVKQLIAQELEADGEFCTLGVVGAARGIDLASLDPEDYDAVANAFGIAPCMAQEIVWENDEQISGYEWIDVEICGPVRPWERHHTTHRTPSANAGWRRWAYMRQWVASQIKNEGEAA